MCGGRGTRLDGDREKPLVPVAGRSMVDRVLDALAAAERVETAYAAVSPHTPRTRERVVARGGGEASESGTGSSEASGSGSGWGGATVVDTPGDGYVADLRAALNAGPTAPTLTVAADLPLLDGAAVDAVCGAHAAADADALSVRVPAARKRELGASADAATRYEGSETEESGARARVDLPAGINVVAGLGGESDEAVRTARDARLAVNVNRPADRRLVERILAGAADAPDLPSGGIDWLDASASTGRGDPR
jgi:adenosylcobinamide-phosphate guanylyltransferase